MQRNNSKTYKYGYGSGLALSKIFIIISTQCFMLTRDIHKQATTTITRRSRVSAAERLYNSFFLYTAARADAATTWNQRQRMKSLCATELDEVRERFIEKRLRGLVTKF
jgi:hypothetical protein